MRRDLERDGEHVNQGFPQREHPQPDETFEKFWKFVEMTENEYDWELDAALPVEHEREKRPRTRTHITTPTTTTKGWGFVAESSDSVAPPKVAARTFTVHEGPYAARLWVARQQVTTRHDQHKDETKFTASRLTSTGIQTWQRSGFSKPQIHEEVVDEDDKTLSDNNIQKEIAHVVNTVEVETS